MTQADLITLVVLALVVAGILLHLRKQKKNGGCCGGCSGCPHAGACHPENKE